MRFCADLAAACWHGLSGADSEPAETREAVSAPLRFVSKGFPRVKLFPAIAAGHSRRRASQGLLGQLAQDPRHNGRIHLAQVAGTRVP